MMVKGLLVAIMLTLLALFFVENGQNYLSFESLKQHRNILLAYTQENFWQAFGIGAGIYIATVALSLPGASILSLADWARARLETMPSTQATMRNLDKNAARYLFVMRAIPLFPFWFVNMISAFSPIKTQPYALVTYLGILPSSFVIVNLGQSLTTVHSMDELFTNDILLSFILIGVLALMTSIISYALSKSENP
ncbi:MAG: TVP38/TMEM64 family protein [Methylococcales bacterium]|nr:TVP38/TMEM64 family protein [Methylococcales bacterium]